MGTRLDVMLEAALRDFLRKNWDILAWHPSDIVEIPSDPAEHSLNTVVRSKLVKQRLHRSSEPKRQAIYGGGTHQPARGWLHPRT